MAFINATNNAGHISGLEKAQYLHICMGAFASLAFSCLGGEGLLVVDVANIESLMQPAMGIVIQLHQRSTHKLKPVRHPGERLITLFAPL